MPLRRITGLYMLRRLEGGSGSVFLLGQSLCSFPRKNSATWGSPRLGFTPRHIQPPRYMPFARNFKANNGYYGLTVIKFKKYTILVGIENGCFFIGFIIFI